jgi:hypothetical protein
LGSLNIIEYAPTKNVPHTTITLMIALLAAGISDVEGDSKLGMDWHVQFRHRP